MWHLWHLGTSGPVSVDNLWITPQPGAGRDLAVTYRPADVAPDTRTRVRYWGPFVPVLYELSPRLRWLRGCAGAMAIAL